jgi:hypothetical protein
MPPTRMPGPSARKARVISAAREPPRGNLAQGKEDRSRLYDGDEHNNSHRSDRPDVKYGVPKR